MFAACVVVVVWGPLWTCNFGCNSTSFEFNEMTRKSPAGSVRDP
jgi:hypothetical protein